MITGTYQFHAKGAGYIPDMKKEGGSLTLSEWGIISVKWLNAENNKSVEYKETN